jgi:hydrogenase nickel incorporation protein HypA/HybF
MHEASIVESLIGLVAESVPPGSRVRRVDVQVGLLTGVSPDSMQLYFELMREATVCAEAELRVTLEPIQAHCDACGADHSLEELAWLCPSCGAQLVKFRNGDELHVRSVEVDDGESIHA